MHLLKTRTLTSPCLKAKGFYANLDKQKVLVNEIMAASNAISKAWRTEVNYFVVSPEQINNIVKRYKITEREALSFIAATYSNNFSNYTLIERSFFISL